MSVNNVGVIGVGPRGLGVVERIIASAMNNIEAEINLLIFDPYLPGSGCHTTDQPDHLLVNTVAEQITMFADDSVVEAGNILSGPTFYQWLCEQRPSADIPAKIHPDGYYSRKLFGQYLNWVFNYILEFASVRLNISYLPLEVVDIEKYEGGWSVQTEDENWHKLDYVFITTGHTKPELAEEQSGLEICDPYPIKEKLSEIHRGDTVAVKGMGLTMCDIMAELTVGRGGEFFRSDNGRLAYAPSGNEPQLIAYSRTGLPLSGRATNQKGASAQYKAKFLTADVVRKLRVKGSIDFIQDVLPLLINDMEYAYYEAYVRDKYGAIESQKFCNSYFFSPPAKRVELINRTIKPEDRFSWQRLISPIPMKVLSSKEAYGKWLLTFIENDLFEAQRGNVNSPIKSASDVLRDLRDLIRDTIDFKGLTEDSHRWIDSVFIPIMNRIAVGPPKERLEEMLALAECGILHLDLGPAPNVAVDTESNQIVLQSTVWPEYKRRADILVHAKISMHSPKDDGTPLWKQLLSKGFTRLYYNGKYHPGGIDVTKTMQVISQDGSVHGNMWALGIPTEGNKFYTFIVPRPGVNSTAIVDAGKAVNQLFALMAENRRALSYAE
ncbi:FAD/NAD(P)-binding protein [Photobacterium halotolerans]|nr:FAD/NAD(P)-binding protein [Photobacterium halotolerans]